VPDTVEQLRRSGVNIYGAGKVAERLIAAFRFYDIAIKQLWDIQATVIGNLSDIHVSPPPGPDTAHHTDATTFVSLLSPVAAKDVTENLSMLGFRTICSSRRLINDILARHCLDLDRQRAFTFHLPTCMLCPLQNDPDQNCSLFDRHITVPSSAVSATSMTHPFIIPRVGLLVTSKCNLTCVGCNHLRDHYVEADNVDAAADMVLSDLALFLDGIDFLKTLVLVGGEAFSHRKIEHIISGILGHEKIGVLQIISNGTVLPTDSVIRRLANTRTFVEVSGYGGKVGEHLVRQRQRFFEKMDAFGVSYRYAETYKWTDFGGFERRGYSENELSEVYKLCCFVSNDILNGELHKCSRSAYGKTIGKIPDYPEDYVTLRGPAPETLRERLKMFFADEKPRVCDHCNGTGPAMIEAGVQKHVPDGA
jgi:hypothetical protein